MALLHGEGAKGAMSEKLKIFVVAHKEAFVPKCEYITPIQVGCDGAEKLMDGFVHDNEGDNISYKNPDYCELTALYWLWKNDDSPYVGLYHYRRYLALSDKNLKKYMLHWKQIHYMGALTQKSFDLLGYDNEKNVERLMDYDLLIPKCSELSYKNIESFYRLYQIGDQDKDLDYALKILIEKYPDYRDAVEECKASKKGYHYNMFIMNRKTLNEYCEWLFSVLDSMYDDMQNGIYHTKRGRMIGFIGEFMMGIFVCKKRNEIRIKELPSVFFKFTDGKKHVLRTNIEKSIRIIYRFFFPVGSNQENTLFRIEEKAKHLVGR